MHVAHRMEHGRSLKAGLRFLMYTGNITLQIVNRKNKISYCIFNSGQSLQVEKTRGHVCIYPQCQERDTSRLSQHGLQVNVQQCKPVYCARVCVWGGVFSITF